MRFSLISLLASALTLSSGVVAAARPATSIEGPFYLSMVSKSPSKAPFPVEVATVSRGALILSTALDWHQQWTYNSTSKRIFIPNPPQAPLGNGPIVAQQPVGFNTFDGGPYPDSEEARLVQVRYQGAVYLVKENAAARGVFHWASQASPGYAVQVSWEGDFAMRIDKTKPSAVAPPAVPA